MSNRPTTAGHCHHPRRKAPRRGSLAATTLLAAVGVAAVGVLQAAPASAAGATGWIRFGHFSPNNGAVRIAIDGRSLTTTATFESVTPYRAVSAGTHTVSLTDLAAPHTVLTDRVAIGAGGALTVGAIQEGSKIALRWYDDDLSPGPAGDAKVRIIDTAPSAPHVRVTLRRGSTTISETAFKTSASGAAPLTVVTPEVPYGEASPYADVAAGTYTVSVSGSGGRQIITGRDWPVTAGTVASVVVVEVHGQATLEVLRDAAGAKAAPVGGMGTGFGGASALLAPGHSSGAPLALGLGGAAGVATFVGVGLGRRRHRTS